MTLIIIGLFSIILSWSVYYLLAIVADSLGNKWLFSFYIFTILYSTVLPFWLFEDLKSALSVSFVSFLFLAFGERALKYHVLDKEAYDEQLIRRINELELVVEEIRNQQKQNTQLESSN